MGKCNCLLCEPVEGKRGHPLYGYDLDKVPAMECFTCGAPIGNEEYVEAPTLARFGQMSFRHKRCETEEAEKNRLLIAKNQKKRIAKENHAVRHNGSEM